MLELSLVVVIEDVKMEESRVSGLFRSVHAAAIEAGEKVGIVYNEDEGHRVSYYIG